MKPNELRVINVASEIGDGFWDLANEWNYFKKDTIGKQIIRSADSMSVHIAKGFGQFHCKENRRFLYYSLGSADKALDWITTSYRRKLTPEDQRIEFKNRLQEFLIKLSSYFKSSDQKVQQ